MILDPGKLRNRLAMLTCAPLDDEDDEELCGWCNGSGEGGHDGSTCSECKGTGVVSDYE